MKVLLGILSCHRDYSCHQDLRKTWLSDVDKFSCLDYKFFLGQDCQQIESDEHVLNAPDHYKGMKDKVKKMLEYAAEHSFDFIFKCDVDTYCHIPRLMASGFEQHDYIGNGGSLPNEQIVPYGGSGYWLSRRAIKILLEKGTSLPKTECEDWWVSRNFHANQDEMKFHLDARYYSLTDLGPSKDNDIITSHQYSDNDVQPHRMITPQERQSRMYSYYEVAKEIEC